MREPAAFQRGRGAPRGTRRAADWAAAPDDAAAEQPAPGDPNFMASLARGLAVIRAFTRQERSQSIAQVSRRTGIPRAAVRRCLYTLERLGYVSAQDHRYSLRPKILSLGHAYLTSAPMTVVAQRFVDQVSAAVRESCSLAVLDEGEILYVVRSTTSTRIMSIDLRPGSRLPAHCTSIGRVLLAALPPADLDALLSRAPLARFTERTITSRPRLLQALAAVRRAGHAIVDQELEVGLRSIAVPVRDPSGRVVAAMNVGTQAARVSVRELETRVLPELEAAATDLGMLLPPSA